MSIFGNNGNDTRSDMERTGDSALANMLNPGYAPHAGNLAGGTKNAIAAEADRRAAERAGIRLIDTKGSLF